MSRGSPKIPPRRIAKDVGVAAINSQFSGWLWFCGSGVWVTCFYTSMLWYIGKQASWKSYMVRITCRSRNHTASYALDVSVDSQYLLVLNMDRQRGNKCWDPKMLCCSWRPTRKCETGRSISMQNPRYTTKPPQRHNMVIVVDCDVLYYHHDVLQPIFCLMIVSLEQIGTNLDMRHSYRTSWLYSELATVSEKKLTS